MRFIIATLIAATLCGCAASNSTPPVHPYASLAPQSISVSLAAFQSTTGIPSGAFVTFKPTTPNDPHLVEEIASANPEWPSNTFTTGATPLPYCSGVAKIHAIFEASTSGGQGASLWAQPINPGTCTFSVNLGAGATATVTVMVAP